MSTRAIFNDGDRVRVKPLPHLQPKLHGADGVIAAWCQDHIYRVKLDGFPDHFVFGADELKPISVPPDGDCPKCGGSSCSHSWEMETVVDPRDARIAELEAALKTLEALRTCDHCAACEYCNSHKLIQLEIQATRRALNPAGELQASEKDGESLWRQN